MKVSTTLIILIAAIVRTDAFDLGSIPKARHGDNLVNDERRREFLAGMLLALPTLEAVKANAEGSIHDKQLFRSYKNPVLPDWVGTALPGPLSLSESFAQINNNNYEILNMGKWPDPILRHHASPIPLSVFKSKNKLPQLQMVARALRNTARKEGAVGLAAQQCGVDVSLVFIDGVNNDKSSYNTGSRIDGDAMKGVFGQSSWRNSQKEIAGEGIASYGELPLPKRWLGRNDLRKQQQQDEGIFLVNPRIVQRSPETAMMAWTENCLVLPPEFRATLLRDAEITIEYESLECLDLDLGSCGSTKQITLQGELARCAQHEMDHDRGTLIVDHVSLDELLSIDGNTFMAEIENADGLHSMRMQTAYSREVSDSTLLPFDEKTVRLAVDRSGKQIGNQYTYEERKRSWFIQSANALDQEVTPAPEQNSVGSSPSSSMDSSKLGSDCDNKCLEERKRIVQERRAMMQQSRSNTRRADVLELSQQRASLYGTKFKGLSPQVCSQPGLCP